VKPNASPGSLVSRPLYSQLPSVDDHVRRMWADNEGADGEGGDDPGDAPTGPSPEPKKRAKARANQRWVSRTDPEAAIISDRRRGLLLARKVHIAVDGGPSRIITRVVATSGDRPESHQVELLLGQHWWLTGGGDEAQGVRLRPGTGPVPVPRREVALPSAGHASGSCSLPHA
jgi:hypothetical protein